MKSLSLFPLLCFALASSSIQIAIAQSSVRDIEEYMVKVRTSSYATLPVSVWQDAKNEAKILKVLAPYYSDTATIVRQKAFYIAKRIGQKSKDASVQRTAIDATVRALKEKDTGVVGNAIDALTGFNKNNFSVSAKDSIATLIKPGTPHLDKLLKLAGFLDLKSTIAQIRDIIISPAPVNAKWAARLALARMGDEEAIQWIVNKLNSANVNDDFVYDAVPDLVYTRQSRIFEFLEGIINSDEQNCHTADPDSEKKILCGYRVMEQIAPAIANFPVKITESGDVDVSEYATALQRVRTWFASNNSYQFNLETYQ
jgi:hypothetical protein